MSWKYEGGILLSSMKIERSLGLIEKKLNVVLGRSEQINLEVWYRIVYFNGYLLLTNNRLFFISSCERLDGDFLSEKQKISAKSERRSNPVDITCVHYSLTRMRSVLCFGYSSVVVWLSTEGKERVRFR